jgi:hypothetical protein
MEHYLNHGLREHVHLGIAGNKPNPCAIGGGFPASECQSRDRERDAHHQATSPPSIILSINADGTPRTASCLVDGARDRSGSNGTRSHRVDLPTLISSESDSAALAPLQQDFCVSLGRLVQTCPCSTRRSPCRKAYVKAPPVFGRSGCPSAAIRRRSATSTPRRRSGGLGGGPARGGTSGQACERRPTFDRARDPRWPSGPLAQSHRGEGPGSQDAPREPPTGVSDL